MKSLHLQLYISVKIACFVFDYSWLYKFKVRIQQSSSFHLSDLFVKLLTKCCSNQLWVLDYQYYSISCQKKRHSNLINGDVGNVQSTLINMFLTSTQFHLTIGRLHCFLITGSIIKTQLFGYIQFFIQFGNFFLRISAQRSLVTQN